MKSKLQLINDVNEYIIELAKPNNDQIAKQLHSLLIDTYGIKAFNNEFDTQLKQLRG